VKSGYSDHLRDLGIVSSHLLPAIYMILELWTQRTKKPFKLEMWSVDDYYISRKPTLRLAQRRC
jgi:hypothetical protein